MKSCAFTGHRPKSLPFGTREDDPRCTELKNRLKAEIETQITKNGVTHFISGMALGVDTFAAEAVLELKENYPQITLECAIPCQNQADKWTETQRARYAAILERADIRTVLQTEYTKDCMSRRNGYMVDHAQILIAVWNGKPSGTGKTVRYAQKCGKNVIIIDPLSLGK